MKNNNQRIKELVIKANSSSLTEEEIIELSSLTETEKLLQNIEDFENWSEETESNLFNGLFNGEDEGI